MGKFLITILLQAVIIAAVGQPADYLWPVKDHTPGSGILSTPQSYIDGELNFSYLFITAPEGSVIVSPVDGTISYLSIGYSDNLYYSRSYTYVDNFDLSLTNAIPTLEISRNPKYLTGRIMIQTDDGRKIYITGLSGTEPFKTGQKVERGSPLGKIHYSYHKFNEPSIKIEISKKNSQADDPMTPFGLRTTFIPPEEIKPVISVTADQAKEDFRIFIDALKEMFPGLYRLLTPEELNAYVEEVNTSLDNLGDEISISRFYGFLNESLAKIHDTHLVLLPPVGGWPPQETGTLVENKPKIIFGWINDTLKVTNTVEGLGNLIGEQIVSYNGYAADSLKKIISSRVNMYDGNVEGYIDYILATAGYNNRFDISGGKNPNDLRIVFADGRTEEFEAEPIEGRPYYYSLDEFYNTNRHPGGYNLRILNDSTAYIGLSSFKLPETSVDAIREFIDSISDKENLIIDVRNNKGGDALVTDKLYSYIAGDSMLLNGYTRVNKKGRFNSFAYCQRYYGMEEDVFPDYIEEEGKEGYFSYSNTTVTPDTLTNYKGRVYVLANENSISAATLFPALVVRNHRGVVVGRETRGAYHFMNALKAADIMLPNSTLRVSIPMVEIVFDTAVNDRVPYGRGVLPDYYVPITIDELSSKEGDAILNYTLKLIGNGQYMKGDNPFKVPLAKNHLPPVKLIVLMVLVTGLILAIIIYRYSKKKQVHKR